MRAIKTTTIPILVISLMGGASAAASADGATTVTSDDGLVVLEVPAGALSGSEVVTVSLRPPDAAPPELSSMGGTPTQYLIEPTDVIFAAPVRLTRRIPLGSIGASADSPLPLGVLAIRHPDATWAWLDGAAFYLDAPRSSIELSGSIDRGGSVFAFVAGQVTSDTATPQAAGIGQVVSPETAVTIAQDLRSAVTGETTSPSIMDAAGATVDQTVATAGEPLTYVTFGDLVVGQPFECHGAGATEIESAFVVEGLGADPRLATTLRLGSTASSVRVSGSLECFE